MNEVVFAAATGAAPALATGAVTAAADAKRRRNQEEEVLTAYSQKELNENWEFKILHTARGEFKKPERLAEVLDEEAQAGWVLVEKFDNSRIRLKRSPDARQNDQYLGIDPWRSYVGQTSRQRDAKVVAGGVAVLVLGIFAVFLIAFLLAGG